MEQVTDELLVDGVKQFEDAMNRLLAGIDEQRAAVVTGRPPTIEAQAPAGAARMRSPSASRRAVGESVAQRVWRRDPSLWGGPGVPEIEDRLGWLTVSETMLEHAPELHAFADEVRDRGLHRRGAAGDGRLLARARGDPPVVRRDPRRPAAAGARLDPSRRDRSACRSRSTSRRRCSSSPRNRAGRSRRSRTTATSRRWPDPSSSSS